MLASDREVHSTVRFPRQDEGIPPYTRLLGALPSAGVTNHVFLIRRG